MASGTWSCHHGAPALGEGGGVGRGQCGQVGKGEVRGQREKPRKLASARAARRLSLPFRALSAAPLGSQEVGASERAGPGGRAPAGRGWAGCCAWVSAILGGGRRAAYL